MTTVIMAKDYKAAAEVALGLGLGRDWLYPHTPSLVLGVHIVRVIYVEGWLHSTTITTETAELVQRNLDPNGVAIIAPRGMATAEVPAVRADVLGPFVEPEAVDQPERRRRRGVPASVIVLVVALLGSSLAAAAVVLARMWGAL